MKHYLDSNGFQYGIPDDEKPKEGWISFDIDNINFIPDPNYKIPYSAARQNNYPIIGEQFDLLYHDIKNGIFGEQAKNSEWFKSIEQVKNNFPKE